MAGVDRDARVCTRARQGALRGRSGSTVLQLNCGLQQPTHQIKSSVVTSPLQPPHPVAHARPRHTPLVACTANWPISQGHSSAACSLQPGAALARVTRAPLPPPAARLLGTGPAAQAGTCAHAWSRECNERHNLKIKSGAGARCPAQNAAARSRAMGACRAAQQQPTAHCTQPRAHLDDPWRLEQPAPRHARVHVL